MTVGERFERLSGAAARRPILTLGVVLALAVTGGLGALRIKPSAGLDTFVSRSSAVYRATADDERHFGDQALIVLIREPLGDLVTTRDLVTLTRLEACLAGQYATDSPALRAYTPVRAGSHAPYGGWGSPCGELMRHRPAQVVYGPGTFLNRAVAAVNTQIGAMLAGVDRATRAAEADAYALSISKGLGRDRALAAAEAAGRLEYNDQLQTLARLYLTSGIEGTPSIDDSQFLSQIVFAGVPGSPGSDQPKARFAYLFPTADSALVQVRLRSSLTDAEQAQAISWIREVIRMPIFRLAHGGTYTVTGVPVVINDLAGEISGSIAALLVAAVVVMGITLLIVFRSRLRLLPLATALAATGITFGLVAVLGVTLTMASVAVLPILIGLGVDYGIQFQARVQETLAVAWARGGEAPAGAEEPVRLPERRAVAHAAGQAAPTIAAAALATAAGFLVLLLSPVPMVRGFGLLLVAGIAIAPACALATGSAALVLAGRGPVARRRGVLGASVRGAGEILEPAARGAVEIIGASLRGAGELLPVAARRHGSSGRRRWPVVWRGTAPGQLVAAAARHPGRVLAVGLALAVAGWVADTQTAVQSDVTKLVPAGMPALRNLRALERITGVSGEIDVTVRASDVATPRTVRWMIGYEDALLSHYGYTEQRGCSHSTLCPALSLPDLFSDGAQAGDGAGLDEAQIDALLSAVPPYFSQAVITPDHREATLAFGIRLMPLSRQQQVIEAMRSRLHPPAGVTASLAGLPVLAAQANAALSSSGRRLLTVVAGLLAVGLVLLALWRDPARAAVPLIPIALATGWSSLVLFLIGIPLNPMSATLGALVIAISTEFSVLLSERYRRERADGLRSADALARTYRSTGIAVAASGVTVIAGFGVLVFSDITMLRDFGFVTLVDLTVSLAGVLVVLPAALALGSSCEALERLGLARSVVSATLGRLRRRPRVA
jgi:hydrophobe/amphiphile efflux-3 (HAE3) family protein